jgi:hypothetical protein
LRRAGDFDAVNQKKIARKKGSSYAIHRTALAV